MHDTIECRSCGQRKWITQFRQFAPGMYRKTCRVCENQKQAEYQRAYERRRREREAADLEVARDDAVAALAARVARLEEIVAALAPDVSSRL